MVFISIYRKSGEIDNTVLRPLISALPQIITEEIRHIPQEEVIVTVQEPHPFDNCPFSLFINIELNDNEVLFGHYSRIRNKIKERLPSNILNKDQVLVTLTAPKIIATKF